MVPALEGKDLIPALIELQEKELYSRLQVRYSSDYEKGLVLEQRLRPVRACGLGAG